jgi:hypothetical protein
MSQYTEITPHEDNHGRGPRQKWIECTCDAGRIGAKHCPKCNGLGFTAIERVKPTAKPETRRRA